MVSEFVHLHVASGYSLRYGTSRPEALVERAVAMGQDALALTDRDGAYGAVAFALACREAGISPILGVDLAVAPQVAPVRSCGATAAVRPPRPGVGWPWTRGIHGSCCSPAVPRAGHRCAGWSPPRTCPGSVAARW